MPIAPALPRTIIRDLELGQLPVTPFVAAPGAIPALPGLLPWQPERGARLVKDVLSVGRWKVGQDELGAPQFWEVSLETLKSIVNSWTLCRQRGTTINLCWGHGDPKTRIVDARDLIAPLDQVFIAGETLWVSVYVTAEQAVQLRNPALKVSVRAKDNWIDGQGNAYPIALLHVAVVDLPVVDQQGPFVDLQNFFLALTEPPMKGAKAMDFAALLEAVNKLLVAAGMSALPDDTTEENIVDRLTYAASLLGEEETDEGEGGGDGDGGDDTPPKLTDPSEMDMANAPPWAKAMVAQNAALVGTVKDLSNSVASLQSDRAAQTQAAFKARVKELAAAGNITAGEVSQAEALGAKFGYDLSLLKPYEGRKAIDLGKGAGRHANPSPPSPGVSGGYTPPTPQQREEAAKQLGGTFRASK